MPTLVLLPGMDGTGTLFSPLVDALSEVIATRIVRYPPTEALDYRALASYVRDRLPSSEPCVLLGESFSGPVAIDIAASRPGNLVGVVLCCTFARSPAPLARWVPVRGMTALLEHLPRALVSWMLLGRFRTDSLDHALRAAIASVPAQVLASRLHSVTTVDVRTQLAAVGVPILQLVAARDRLVPPRSSQEIEKHAPGVTSVVIEAPHMLLQCRPDAAAQEITRFIGGLSVQR